MQKDECVTFADMRFDPELRSGCLCHYNLSCLKKAFCCLLDVLFCILDRLFSNIWHWCKIGINHLSLGNSSGCPKFSSDFCFVLHNLLRTITSRTLMIDLLITSLKRFLPNFSSHSLLKTTRHGMFTLNENKSFGKSRKSQ